MFRDGQQFATDQMALAIAREAIDMGYDDGMDAERRGFLYMPFEHSEDLSDQRQSLLLFTALGSAEHIHFARKHYEVIEKFGRFPHRNAILGSGADRARDGGGRGGAVMALVEAGRYFNSFEAGLAKAGRGRTSPASSST